MPESTHSHVPTETGHLRPTARRNRPVWSLFWKVIPGVLCVVILAAGVYSFQALSSLKEEPPRSEPVDDVFQVEVYEVESADVRRIISAFGAARSDRVVVVSSEIAGRIVEAGRLQVGRTVVGDHVEIVDGRSERVAGDALVQIDTELYQRRVDRIQKLIDQLQTDHATNQRILSVMTEIYERKLDLFRDEGAVTESEMQRITLEFEQFKSSVDGYEVRRDVLLEDLELARLDLQKATVRPPYSGVIAEVMAEEGQYVQVGEPLFRLTNNDLVEIPVAVSLADSLELAAELAEGRYPEVALAISETAPPMWFGNVMRIAPIANEETRTVDVFVEVHNDEQAVPLQPGTFLHARIQGAVLRDALLIPRDAIVSGTVYVAWRQETDPADAREQAERREIVVERIVQSLALVRGVRPGDRIVLTNLDVIESGTLIRTEVIRSLDDELTRIEPAYAVRIGGSDPEDFSEADP